MADLRRQSPSLGTVNVTLTYTIVRGGGGPGLGSVDATRRMKGCQGERCGPVGIRP